MFLLLLMLSLLLLFHPCSSQGPPMTWAGWLHGHHVPLPCRLLVQPCSHTRAVDCGVGTCLGHQEGNTLQLVGPPATEGELTTKGLIPRSTPRNLFFSLHTSWLHSNFKKAIICLRLGFPRSRHGNKDLGKNHSGKHQERRERKGKSAPWQGTTVGHQGSVTLENSGGQCGIRLRIAPSQ